MPDRADRDALQNALKSRIKALGTMRGPKGRVVLRNPAHFQKLVFDERNAIAREREAMTACGGGLLVQTCRTRGGA